MAASIGFNADNQFTVGGTALDYGKNFIINGGFDYWNYATSQTTTGYGSDDRWSNANNGSTKTHSRVESTDTERALFNSSKFSRTVVASVAGAGNYTIKTQAIENVTKLAGKTVTISFWAKADSTKNIGFRVVQGFGAGGTPSSALESNGQLISLTSTWQKKTITMAIPSIVGKTIGTDGVHTSFTGVYFGFDIGSTYSSAYGGAIQQSGTFDIAEVKLEVGTVATPWTPYEGEFGGEVQACKRYYETGGAQKCEQFYDNRASTELMATITFKATKRVVPTVISCVFSSGTYVSSTKISVNAFSPQSTGSSTASTVWVDSFAVSAEL